MGLAKRVLLLACLVGAFLVSVAIASVECFEEHYGGGSCATVCVYYDDQTGNVIGWMRGPFYQC